MAYVRKTRDDIEVQGHYAGGWECVTTEETWKLALAQIKTYRENERGTAFRLKLVRVRI